MAGLSLPLLCGLLIVVTMTAGQSGQPAMPGPPATPGSNRRPPKNPVGGGSEQPQPVMSRGARDSDEKEDYESDMSDKKEGMKMKRGFVGKGAMDYEDDDCYTGKEDDMSEYDDEDSSDGWKAKGGDDWGMMGLMGPGWMKKMWGEDGGEKGKMEMMKMMKMMEMRMMHAEMVYMTRMMRMLTGSMFGFGMGPGMFGGGMGGMNFNGGMDGMGGKGHKGGNGGKSGKGGEGKWDTPRRPHHRKPCPKPRQLPSICSVVEKATSKNIFNRTCPEDHVCMPFNATRCSDVSIKICLHRECLNKSPFDSRKCMEDKLEKAMKKIKEKKRMIEEEQENASRETDMDSEEVKEIEKLEYSVARMRGDEPNLVMKYVACLIPDTKKMGRPRGGM